MGARAQTNVAPLRQFTTNAHGWYDYFGDHPVKAGSKWGIHLEGQWRRHDVITRWQQLLIRPGVNYEVNKNLMLTAGYGYITTHRYGEFPTAVPFPEHRIFQQALVRQALGKWNLSHRYRLEQRFLGEKRALPDGTRELLRRRYENRFRYMYRMMRPIHGLSGMRKHRKPALDVMSTSTLPVAVSSPRSRSASGAAELHDGGTI